jgi:3-oxoacyl-[acyl-carrier protein] reductase
MSDYLVQLANQPATRNLIKRLGLPTPVRLARADGPYAERPLAGKNVLVGETAPGRVASALQGLLTDAGAELIRDVAALAERASAYAMVFDATGLTGAESLASLYDFFHDAIGRLGSCGRIVVITGVPDEAKDSAQAAAFRAVEGFVRSLAKEIGKRGATGNMIYLADGAEDRLVGPLRFLLSAHSAYVDGQAFTVTTRVAAPKSVPLTKALDKKVALVTGGARGIGAATAARLTAEGAHVVVLDIPQDKETLEQTAKSIGGTPLAVDITAADAPQTISEFLRQQFGGVDIVVHNAGVTRDKTLAKMPKHFWDLLLNINLGAILRIDARLHADKTLRDEGRIVCLSSIGGIAGNVGQTNYGASKAGLIGYVRAEAPKLAGRGIGINAVAPGFIETRMTAAMPFTIREAGRRMNSLSQGGQPQDVAELITFLATPGAVGVSGNVIRVCGQSLIGA